MKEIRDLEDKELLEEFERTILTSDGSPSGEFYQAEKAELLRRMESRIY